jgi:hypothetical protein
LLDKNDPETALLMGAEKFRAACKLVANIEGEEHYWRMKFKANKPTAVPMSAFDSLVESSESGGNESISSELICLVANQGKLFYDEMDGKAYVTANVKTRIVEFTTTGGVNMPEMDVEHTMLTAVNPLLIG